MNKKMMYVFLSMLLMSCSSSSDGDLNEMSEHTAVINRLVINEVDIENQKIEFFNDTSETVDITSYWLCINNGGGYIQLSDSGVRVDSGSLNLSPGAYVVVDLSGSSVDGRMNNANGSDIGLYVIGSFTSSNNIIDYVRYGVPVSPGRQNVAVEANVWQDGDAVDVSALQQSSNMSIFRDQSSLSSASSWSVGTKSLGAEN